jgi:hypothetical protein
MVTYSTTVRYFKIYTEAVNEMDFQLKGSEILQNDSYINKIINK